MKLRIHSQTSAMQALKFENGEVILWHILLGVWVLKMLGLKLIHMGKSVPAAISRLQYLKRVSYGSQLK